jgi:hypothetical protein
MTKIVIAASASWLLIGALLPGMAPLSLSGPSTEASAATPTASAEANGLDVKSYGPRCSDKSWPYYEPSCIRDTNAANREAKPVRIVDGGKGTYGVEFTILP